MIESQFCGLHGSNQFKLASVIRCLLLIRSFVFAEAASGALLGAEDVHFGVNRLATPADDGHFYARPSAGYAAPHHHSHRSRQQVKPPCFPSFCFGLLFSSSGGRFFKKVTRLLFSHRVDSLSSGSGRKPELVVPTSLDAHN